MWRQQPAALPSRAPNVAAGAALAPSVDAATSISRANQQSTLPMGTVSQAALQARWEIDLFGANRAARDAAQERYDSARAGWHDARVSVAAEVANQYYGLRACEQLLAVARQDAASRADTARLTELSAQAGFQSPPVWHWHAPVLPMAIAAPSPSVPPAMSMSKYWPR
jgi:outer membrane protein TolC